MQTKLVQKQLPRGVRKKRCSENMQQIYRDHPCWRLISIKLFCNFTEIALRHGCSPENLLHIFRTSFPRNTSRWLLLVSTYLNKVLTRQSIQWDQIFIFKRGSIFATEQNNIFLISPIINFWNHEDWKIVLNFLPAPLLGV